MIDQPGISRLTMSEYLADPCPVPSLSSGCAHRLIAKSPLHAWQDHPRLGGMPQEREADDDTEDDESREQSATLVGKISHELLLGGDGKISVIEPSEYRSDPKRKGEEGSIPKGWTNGAIRAARAQALANGLLPILPKQMAAAKRMERVAREFMGREAGVGDGPEIIERLRRAFDSGEGELTMIWQEGKTWFRARPDWLNYEQKVLVHYKTTKASANPEPFMRGIMESMGYDVSLAFYRRGLEALTGEKDWLHVILVQEQTLPHACSLVTLDSVKWAIADDKVNAAVELWNGCLASHRWPAYPGRIHYAQPRPWELADMEVSYA